MLLIGFYFIESCFQTNKTCFPDQQFKGMEQTCFFLRLFVINLDVLSSISLSEIQNFNCCIMRVSFQSNLHP